MRIYNLGSLNIDYVYQVEHFVSAGETLASTDMQIFAGGKGLNQSVALAKAGATVLHGAVLGNDGDMLQKTLAAAGVDTSRLQKGDTSSGHAIIQVDKNGQNCILLFSGANCKVDELYINQFLCDAKEDDILLLQNETSGLADAMNIARQKGMQIAFNPSPIDEALTRLPLESVKWWFCNETECEALFGSCEAETVAQSFRERYPDAVLIMTLGAEGCVYIDRERMIPQPAYKVKAVDTTAAGDTFTGYFLAAVTRGAAVEDALRLATKASSITVTRPGASDSIPTLDEVKI